MYTHGQNIGKPNNLKVVRRNQVKGPNGQIRLIVPMSGGGEP